MDGCDSVMSEWVDECVELGFLSPKTTPLPPPQVSQRNILILFLQTSNLIFAISSAPKKPKFLIKKVVIY